MPFRYLILVLCLLGALGLQAKVTDEFQQQVLEVIENNPEFINKVVQDYLVTKREAEAEELFQENLKIKDKIDFGQSPSFGKADAKYQLVVFTDLQCSYCKRGEKTVRELKTKYGSDLLIVYKNQPLAFHKHAIAAAKAALAAHQQSMYREYVQAVFAKQNSLSDELLLEIAQDLKLDIAKFNKDRQSPQTEKILEADRAQAIQLEISGTPCFFLNGVRVAGAYPLEYFEKIIKTLAL